MSDISVSHSSSHEISFVWWW